MVGADVDYADEGPSLRRAPWLRDRAAHRLEQGEEEAEDVAAAGPQVNADEPPYSHEDYDQMAEPGGARMSGAGDTALQPPEWGHPGGRTVPPSPPRAVLQSPRASYQVRAELHAKADRVP